MKRTSITPRADWQTKVEKSGLIWHTAARDKPYWDESAYYSFKMSEIEEIEKATSDLYELFLYAGDEIVEDEEMLTSFGIPSHCHEAIQTAWRDEPPALNFGRFDFGYTGDGPPKLFEFNCDTPTSLLEAAVIQWEWKEELFPKNDQFTSLHEKLIAKWRDIRPYIPGNMLHFACTSDDAREDRVTTAYLCDLAKQARFNTTEIAIDDIGWDSDQERFVDLDNMIIQAMFKLYPWEWLANEAFGEKLIDSLPTMTVIEPIWKMMWSNKAILPVLSKMYPNHPNLLRADTTPMTDNFVKKPVLAREGANISITRNNEITAETKGEYGEEGYIYQEMYDLKDFGNGYPVIGSWIVDGEPAGMGIREDGLITGNTARFIPHIID